VADVVIGGPPQENKPHEDFIIGLTFAGTLKRMTAKHVSMSNKTSVDKLSGIDAYKQLVMASTGKQLYIFTDKGNCYKMLCEDVAESKWREKGTQLKELFSVVAKDENIVHVSVADENLPAEDLLFFTKQGMVKRTAWSEYDVQKKSFQAIKLKEDDLVIGIETEVKNTTILYVTRKGMVLNFEKADVPQQGRVSGGVKGMLIADNDEVVFATQAGNKGDVVVVTEKCFAKRVSVKEIEISARYRKGVKIIDLVGTNGQNVLFAGYFAKPGMIACFTDEQVFTMQTNDVGSEPRTGKGKPPKDNKKGILLNDVCNCETSV